MKDDGGREIQILNFAVSVASKNKNIEGVVEDEEIRIFRSSISTGFEVYGSHGTPQESGCLLSK